MSFLRAGNLARRGRIRLVITGLELSRDFALLFDGSEVDYAHAICLDIKSVRPRIIETVANDCPSQIESMSTLHPYTHTRLGSA